MGKMRKLLKGHIDDMSNAHEKPSQTLKSLKSLMKKPMKQIIVQLKKDIGTFYENWELDFVQFYLQIEKSGIFPYYEALNKMYDKDVDRAQMKRFETNVESFKIDVAKCKGKKKMKCLTKNINNFKDKTAELYGQLKKFGAYSHFTAYIGRAYFGLNQTRTSKKDINRSLEAFAKHERPWAEHSFQNLFTHFVYAGTKARRIGSCDVRLAFAIRRPLEILHQDSIDCERSTSDKKKESCLEKLAENWKETHETNMTEVDKLPCPAAITRYVLESSYNLIAHNENLVKPLEKFSKTYLYRSFTNLLHYYKVINKLTFVKPRKGTYFDDCSLPILVEVKEFLLSDENHDAIQTCKVIQDHEEMEKCYGVIVMKYRAFFDGIEDELFERDCELLRFHDDLYEFLLDLRGPLTQPEDKKYIDGVIQGLNKLDEFLHPYGSSRGSGKQSKAPKKLKAKKKKKKAQESIDFDD